MEFNATFIVAFFSFIFLVFVMNWILYKPIDEIVKKRKNFIDWNFQESTSNKEEKNSILEEKSSKLNLAKANAREEFSSNCEKIKNEKNEKLSIKRKQMASDLNSKREVLEKEKEEAKNSLKAEIINMAQIVSDKFLKEHEEIEEIDHELINQIMQG